ncbi:putative reverse transcriptase domain-containing protein [Tanacetum coccineum]
MIGSGLWWLRPGILSVSNRVLVCLTWIVCCEYGAVFLVFGRERGKTKKGESADKTADENLSDAGVVPYVTVESGNATKEVVSPFVVDETVAMETQSPLVNTTGLGSHSPLPTQDTTSAGNVLGKSSYANVTGKPSGKKVNFWTLFTPRGNGIDVVVPVESIRAISERFANTAYGFFLGKAGGLPWLFSFQFSSMEGLNAMLENGPWFIHNNPLILRKWHPDVNLLKEDVGTIPVWVKLHGVPVMAFSEDGLSAISTKLAVIELRADVELKDNIVAAMPKITREGYYTCIGETNNLKKTSQTPKGILVGQKMGFKPTKQVFQPVSKKPTANASVNKKKNVEPAKKQGLQLFKDNGCR